MALSEFPGFDNLFEIASRFSRSAYIAELSIDVDRALSCLREELSVPRIVARWGGGASRPEQISWTTGLFPLILDDTVCELLRADGVTGWASLPCDLHSKDGALLTGFNFLTVSGRCGPIEDERSSIVQKEYPGGVFPAMKGLFFDPESWDGTDFFTTTDRTGWVFVTKRVRDALKRAKIRNLAFHSLGSITRVPPSAYETLH
jgi:hypothetical protein